MTSKHRAVTSMLISFVAHFALALPAVSFTPAVGIPERACGALDAQGRCTGQAFVPGSATSAPPEPAAVMPISTQDLLNRLSPLSRLALDISRGTPGALERYLAELHRIQRPPVVLSKPIPRPYMSPPGAFGGTDLSANFQNFLAARANWLANNPPPPPPSPFETLEQPAQRSGQSNGDMIEGQCDFSPVLDNNTYICYRLDLGYSTPNGANCESDFRGRKNGLPVRYCDGA